MIAARKSDSLARAMEACAFGGMGRVLATWTCTNRVARSYRARTHVRCLGSGVT